jgi:hypothetical protein
VDEAATKLNIGDDLHPDFRRSLVTDRFYNDEDFIRFSLMICPAEEPETQQKQA